MQGLMMERPLSVVSLIEHAARCHSRVGVVSATTEGPIHRYTYRDAFARVGQLAHALDALGVAPGDRVGTLAVNGYRHFELYYAVSGVGAVCHTINPRLFEDQIAFIVDHAADRFVFVDLPFVPLVEGMADRLAKVEGFVVMTDAAHMPETSLPNAMCYEALIDGKPGTYAWPEVDERQAAAMCYTSGTTGNPKGVLYSHRSTVLHALGVLAHSFGLNAHQTVLPVVPMFHVQAWGMPYAAAICGAKLVFAGTRLDGESLHELIEGEGVTMALGVPTVWLGYLDHLRRSGARPGTLRLLGSGGSAPPMAMIEAFEKDYGVEVHHGWGMTETSPIAAAGISPAVQAALPEDKRLAEKVKQGQMLWGVEMKIVDDDGRPLPHDGAATGELLVRGPWVLSAYYDDEAGTAAAFDADGWFRTGDVAAIDDEGQIRLTDRTKDLIKSGGEWISSIDLENAAMGHADVAEAAAIAMPHPKWGERPLLVVRPRDGATPTADEIVGFLDGKVAKWQLPDAVVFREELPHTATGKVSKQRLREAYQDYVLPTAKA